MPGNFKIADNKGFYMTFENGWTISVQWGRLNLADNRYLPPDLVGEDIESTTAECAVWDNNGEWRSPFALSLKEPDTLGYMTANEVLKLMGEVAAREPC